LKEVYQLEVPVIAGNAPLHRILKKYERRCGTVQVDQYRDRGLSPGKAVINLPGYTKSGSFLDKPKTHNRFSNRISAP